MVLSSGTGRGGSQELFRAGKGHRVTGSGHCERQLGLVQKRPQHDAMGRVLWLVGNRRATVTSWASPKHRRRPAACCLQFLMLSEGLVWCLFPVLYV